MEKAEEIRNKCVENLTDAVGQLSNDFFLQSEMTNLKKNLMVYQNPDLQAEFRKQFDTDSISAFRKLMRECELSKNPDKDAFLNENHSVFVRNSKIAMQNALLLLAEANLQKYQLLKE